MDWIQAALDASEESEESNDNEAVDSAVEKDGQFDEKKIKENTNLLKFGREHLQRIKNINSTSKAKSAKNDNAPTNRHVARDIFTLQTQRLVKNRESELINDNYANSLKEKTESTKEGNLLEDLPIQECSRDSISRDSISRDSITRENPINEDIMLRVPKGKEWKGFEKCATHIYGDSLVGNPQQRSNLGPLKEDLKSINFNLPAQTFTTSDGEILQSNQIRRTQKRKHQINWLAMEAQEHEFELLQQTSHMRKTKRETQMKYGW